MFQVGQRIRTTRINPEDYAPAWEIGATGTIQSLGRPEWNEDWANVVFDPPTDIGTTENSDIVNFDEMEVIDEAD